MRVQEGAGTRLSRAPAGGVVLLVLGALVALGPAAIDAYVPGLPELAQDLRTSPSAVQLTVTACLVGLAVGQLLAGPLSDVLGRRTPLVLGVTVYTAGALLCAVAPTVELLVVFRFVQGVGGAFALVIAYAAVRDRYSGREGARYFSVLLLVAGLAPVLAPLVGAQVLAASGWRAVFVVLAALSGAVLLAVLLALPESLPVHRRRPGGLRATRRTYLDLLTDRPLVGYALTNAFVFAAMFAYIAGSPFILQDIYGLSAQQYSLVFAVNAFGLVAAAQVSGRLVHRVDARVLLRNGVALAGAGGIGLLLVVTVDAGLLPLLVAFFVVVTSVGLVLPNATALGLEHHGANAGAAAALLGFGQYLFGGLVAPLVGVQGSTSALPTALVMAGLGLAAALALRSARDHAPEAAGRQQA